MGVRALLGVVLGGAAITLSTGCSLKEKEPDVVAGKKLFVERCGSCHTLARAETKGTSGPNLDEAFQQAVKDGMGRDGIAAAVRDQIQYPARLDPKNPGYMPPNLVEGEGVNDVATYVADATAKGGEDQGALADAVPKAGAGKPAVAKGGVLEIPATAQLAYETQQATAPAGELEIKSPNPSGTPHNIALDGPGVADVKGPVVQDGGSSDIKVKVQKGEYVFYCTVPGHREGGMEGKLKVE